MFYFSCGPALLASAWGRLFLIEPECVRTRAASAIDLLTSRVETETSYRFAIRYAFGVQVTVTSRMSALFTVPEPFVTTQIWESGCTGTVTL